MLQYLTSTFLVVMTILKIDWPEAETRKSMAAILVFLIWSKMFDWLRLFDTTSFYIKLIVVTITDILPFFLIFPIFLLMFGSSMYILQTNRGDKNAVVEEYVGWWGIDTTFNQYLLSLGEFGIDEFSNGPQAALCYIFFLLSTFLTQVTALNMIIAIMSDTFGKVTEGYEQHSREMKISLLADYVSIIRKDLQEEQNSFLVIVTAEEDAIETEWEGTVNQIRMVVETETEKLHDDVKQRHEILRDMLLEQKARQSLAEKETRKQISELRQFQTKMLKRIDEGFNLVNNSKAANQKSQA